VLPPHFGQAAAQCIEDAVVLGALLRERLDRDALLERFMSRRGERARQVHALVTQAARWDLQPEASTDLPALAERLAPLIARPA
jgi:2-polyprenyl-6-methoxyphenol hydroxylase-like FAD-dependent oxidoreductase